jgi:hypothetical protein
MNRLGDTLITAELVAAVARLAAACGRSESTSGNTVALKITFTKPGGDASLSRIPERRHAGTHGHR